MGEPAGGETAGGSGKAIAAALAANLGVAAGKFVAFLFSGSSALLAEAFHSVADSIDQLLLVAMVIFLAGGAFSLWEGVQKIRNPEPLEGAVWAFAVLGLAVVLESFSLRTAIRESAPASGVGVPISDAAGPGSHRR